MGDYVEADEARRMGLVNEVCDDDEVDERARQMADELTTKAPLGVEKAIEALNHAGDVPLEDGLRIEQYLSKDLYDTEDAQEGFAARMEGREPEFEGR
jgi:enoyl-CoA hydratase